jgi:hypothetical protein
MANGGLIEPVKGKKEFLPPLQPSVVVKQERIQWREYM